MADNKISEMISAALEGIRSVADSGTVVGDPIPTNNGTVIIPVSKVSVGLATGGLDYLPKSGDKDKKEAPAATTGGRPAPRGSAPCFGGGGGTGISVTPLCFLVVNAEGSVSMLNITNPAAVPPAVGVIDSVSSFAEKAPDIVSRFKSLFSKKKTEKSLDDEKLTEEIDALSEKEKGTDER